MKALIVVGGSEGQRRCDSRCYDATSLDCDCVCGSVNHGVGLMAARSNTEEMAQDLVKEYQKRGEDISIPLLQNQLVGER